MPLHFRPRIETIERESTPGVVGIVSVGGELQENFAARGCIGSRGPNNKKEITFRRAATFVSVGAAAIFRAEPHFVISSLPIGGNLEAECCGPIAAMRGGVFGNGMLCARNVVGLENSPVCRAEPCDLKGERR